MDHDFAVGVWVAVGDGHAERVRDERGVLAVIDRPANDASTERVEHDAAVKLSFSRGVLGDVGDPQPVRFDSGEVPVDEVGGGNDAWDLLASFRAWEAVDLGSRHQHLDGVVADLDASVEGEFSVDASGAIGASRCGVHLDDLIEQPTRGGLLVQTALGAATCSSRRERPR
jgi:hypothetical protein